jgi:hypothetical protein
MLDGGGDHPRQRVLRSLLVLPRQVRNAATVLIVWDSVALKRRVCYTCQRAET